MTTVAGLVSVLLVAAGLFYTNDANRKQQQLGLSQQKLALQGQIADRFTAAIGQLGQEDNKKRDKLSIRLGGIYALQRLMFDSPVDERAVVHVLCAFVNTHAPRPATPPKVVPPSPADVRAAVTVLGYRPNPLEQPLDLSNVILGLPGVDLYGADLTGADLGNSSLRGADLREAGLNGVDLHGTDLDYANLTGANLTGAYLTDASFSGAYLNHADLFGANLTGADLHGSYLTGANLRRAQLSDADLTPTDLQGAYLQGADLSGADLRGADLSGANLTGADLAGADLQGADVSSSVGLTAQQLTRAQLNGLTRFPPDVVWPSPAPS
ncbi:pentapeptide repeat-containing protein [Actinoplanes oblitus]|uniref:Pentapeptide repeat-containing protein n=1 Tax=Actinoplanes oblitus TaxID=3040509 RepID=A0ABY8WQS9_9ACTN|nr:pentapeptide repeat-containing protein [Actinoplanes oblitus]WIN00211.1 pentapeptide repeat-containing protein [Actinoplanes oblitus]